MAKKSKVDIYINKAIELGATEAKIIDPKSIITAPWVRLKCQFGCAGYNSSFCCPPHSPAPEETRKVIDCYHKALLVHGTGLGSVTKIVVKLEREVFLDGFYKALSFGSGPCNLCKECPDEGCKHPGKARPSMEACGIDVYATARLNNFPIKVAKTRESEENYYGVVLID